MQPSPSTHPTGKTAPTPKSDRGIHGPATSGKSTGSIPKSRLASWEWEQAQGHGSCAIRPWPGSQDSPSPSPSPGGHSGHSTGRAPDAKSSSWNKPQPSLVSSCSRQLNSPAIVTLITSGNY